MMPWPSGEKKLHVVLPRPVLTSFGLPPASDCV